MSNAFVRQAIGAVRSVFLQVNGPAASAAPGGSNAATLQNDVGDLRMHAAGGSGIAVSAGTGFVGLGGVQQPAATLDVSGAARVSGVVTAGGFVGAANASALTTGTISNERLPASLNASNLRVTGHVLPTANVAYDLGSADMRFRDLFLSGNTINIGDAAISLDAAGLNFGSNVFAVNMFAVNLHAEKATLSHITATEGSAETLTISGTLNASLDSVAVQVGTKIAELVDIGTNSNCQVINIGTGPGLQLLNIGTGSDAMATIITIGAPGNTLQLRNPSGDGFLLTNLDAAKISGKLPPSALPTSGLASTAFAGTVTASNLAVYGNVDFNGSPYVASQWTTVASGLTYGSNVRIAGTLYTSNLAVLGAVETINAYTTMSSNLVVANAGTGPALAVSQSEAGLMVGQPVATFSAGSNLGLMVAGGQGFVGVGGIVTPVAALDVSGNAQVSGNVNVVGGATFTSFLNGTFVATDVGASALSISGNTTGSVPASAAFTPFPGVSEGGVCFNGAAGNYVSFPSTVAAATYAWGSAATPMTVEAWIYVTSYGTTIAFPPLVGAFTPGGGGINWSFGFTSTGTLRFYYYNGSLMYVNSAMTVALNTWTHIAMTSDTSTNIRLFINGTLVAGPTAVSGTPTSGGLPFTIGQNNTVPTNAYVTSLRMVTGAALYTTSAFTPSNVPLEVAASGTTAFLLRVPLTPSMSGSVAIGTTRSYMLNVSGNTFLGGTAHFASNVGVGKPATSNALDVSGTLVATFLAGSGAGLTNLNASALTTGVISAALLPPTIANASYLTTGTLNNALLVGGGAGLTSLNASALVTGVINAALLPPSLFTNLNASALTTGLLNAALLPPSIYNAAYLTSGILNAALLPSSLSAAVSGTGSNLTNLNASALTTGLLNAALLPPSIYNAAYLTTGTLNAALLPSTINVAFHVGGGAGLTSLNACALTTGVINAALLPSSLSTNTNASALTTGTISAALLPPTLANAAYLTSGLINAALLPPSFASSSSNTNASALSTGVLNAALLPPTLANAAYLTSGLINAALLPPSLSTNTNASALSTGTLSAALLPASVHDASTLTSGTLDTARLPATIAVAGDVCATNVRFSGALYQNGAIFVGGGGGGDGGIWTLSDNVARSAVPDVAITALRVGDITDLSGNGILQHADVTWYDWPDVAWATDDGATEPLSAGEGGSLACRYAQIGHLVQAKITLTVGAAGSHGVLGCGWTWTLPIAASASAASSVIGSALVTVAGVTHYVGVARLSTGGVVQAIVSGSATAVGPSAAGPTGWPAGSTVCLTVAYEAASAAAQYSAVASLAYADYAPTWSGTIGNGSLAGRWYQVGTIVNVQLSLVVGTSTTLGSTNSAWAFSLPVPATAGSAALATPVAILADAAYTAYAQIDASQVTFRYGNAHVGNAVPVAWQPGHALSACLSYDAAALAVPLPQFPMLQTNASGAVGVGMAPPHAMGTGSVVAANGFYDASGYKALTQATLLWSPFAAVAASLDDGTPVDPGAGGSLASRYCWFGATVTMELQMRIGAGASLGLPGSGWRWNLPVAPAPSSRDAVVGTALMRSAAAAASYTGVAQISADGAFVKVFVDAGDALGVACDAPFAWAAGDRASLLLSYEAASAMQPAAPVAFVQSTGYSSNSLGLGLPPGATAPANTLVVAGALGVGGIATPACALDVSGDIRTSGDIRVSGTLFASLNASSLAAGTISNARLPSTINVTTLMGGTLVGQGTGITALNASSIATGTLDNALLPVNVDVAGNCRVSGTLTCSNVAIVGSFETVNAYETHSSNVVIANLGTGPALVVSQTGDGTQPVATFSVGSNAALVVGSTGNVGVGKTSPAASLDVSGSVNVIGNLLVSSNVGIGRTNPASALDVSGNVNVTGMLVLPRRDYIRTGFQQGSQGNPAVCYTTLGVNNLQNIITYTPDLAYGDTFTILIGGLFSITASFSSAASTGTSCIDKNQAWNTMYNSGTAGKTLVCGNRSGNYEGYVSWTGYLVVGDIIRVKWFGPTNTIAGSGLFINCHHFI